MQTLSKYYHHFSQNWNKQSCNVWNQQRPWIGKGMLRRKTIRRHHNAWHQAVLQNCDLQDMWYWHRNRLMDQRIRRENPEMDHQLHVPQTILVLTLFLFQILQGPSCDYRMLDWRAFLSSQVLFLGWAQEMWVSSNFCSVSSCSRPERALVGALCDRFPSYRGGMHEHGIGLMMSSWTTSHYNTVSIWDVKTPITYSGWASWSFVTFVPGSGASFPSNI